MENGDVDADVILTLYETYPINLVKKYTNHPELKPSDKEKLEKILYSIERNNGVLLKGACTKVLKVDYKYAKGRNSGRLYAKNELSYQSLSRVLRNALACETHFDLDIANCNPTLLLQLCKKHEWNTPQLEMYINKRSYHLFSISEKFNCSYENAKQLVLSIINGGSFESWARKQNSQKNPTPFLKEFILELFSIRTKIWDAYPQFHEDAFAKVAQKKEKGKISAGPEATCMSYIITDIENTCLQAIRKYLQIIGFEMTTLIFDGGLVKKNEEHELNAQIITDCEQYCHDVTGYKVNLVVKPMENTIPDNPFCTQLKDFVKNDYVVHLPFTQQYVSDANLPVYPMLLLISPPGTGKTHYIANEIQEILYRAPTTSITIPSPRIAVTKQHMGYFEKMGFQHYSLGSDTQKLITTIDSINRDNLSDRRNVILLDEIEASLQHMFGATLQNKRLVVFAKLLEIINLANRVFAVDGDIGDLTLTFFRFIFEQRTQRHAEENRKSVLVAQNSFKPQPKKITFVDKYQWYNQLHKLLQDDKSKIYIGCDSCSTAQVIARRIEKWWTKNSYNNVLLLYTSRDGNKEDLEKASESWASAKVVVCSPTIGPATDYNNVDDPFTAILGFYIWDGKTIGALQIGQQLKRARDTAFQRPADQSFDYMIYCRSTQILSDDNFYKYPKQISDIELILQRLSMLEQSSDDVKEFVQLNCFGNTTVRKDPLSQLYVQFIRNRNLSRGQLLSTLHYMSELNGHYVTYQCTYCQIYTRSAYLLREHCNDCHSDCTKKYDDNILSSCDESLIKQEIWIEELKNYEDLTYNSNEDDDAVNYAKKMYLKEKDQRTRKWLDINVDAIIPKNTALFPIMIDEKSQNAYTLFELFCRTGDRLQISPFFTEQLINLIESYEPIINLISDIEINILKCKRLQCLYWSDDKVRKLFYKKPNNVELLNHRIDGLKKNNAHGQDMRMIRTMYDAYVLVCMYYKHFIQSTVDQDNNKPSLIVSHTEYVFIYAIAQQKLRKPNLSELICHYCNKSKPKEEFHYDKSTIKCKRCSDTRFTLYRFDHDAYDTLAEYIEIITSQPHYKPENYRYTEEKFLQMIGKRKRVFNEVWKKNEITLDQLAEKTENLFTEFDEQNLLH